MSQALQDESWQIVLADYNLPSFSAPDALTLLQNSGKDIPFIVISGGIGEDIAVAMMKAGAHDYLMKGHLARLVPAVERELREAATRTARRRAEEAMRESELRYRTLWENSADAVVMMDTDSVIHFANPAVLPIFGYTPEELIGQNLSLLLPERATGERQESLVRCLKRDFKGLERQVLETIGVRKDEGAVIVEIVCREIDFHGQHWYVAFIRNVTERREQEAALREHAEQFRVAREIQERLFPKGSPAVPGFDIAGLSKPAEAAGGDYFDYLPMLQDRLGLVVADVTGHGVGPALIMAETRAYLRLLARNREDLGDILARANRALAEDMGGDRFVTLFLAAIHPQGRELAYTSAGHCPGFLMSADGSLRMELKRTGMALGLRSGAKFQTSDIIPLEPGDVLLLLTDGIEETPGPDDTFFGKERTIQVLRECRHQAAAEIVQTLYDRVRDFAVSREQMDDFTAVVMKVL
jgi:PAS domain S-box-containing protein